MLDQLRGLHLLAQCVVVVGGGTDQLEATVGPGPTASVVRRHPAGDAIEPAPHGAAGLVEVVEATMDHEEDVLHQIVQVQIGQPQMPQRSGHKRRMLAVDRCESRAVAVGFQISGSLGQLAHSHGVQNCCCPPTRHVCVVQFVCQRMP